MLTLTFFAFALLVGAVCLVLALVAGVILFLALWRSAKR